jgi:thiol-disulfide isomerase/thioredoxin
MRNIFICLILVWGLGELSAQTINIKVSNLPKGKAVLSYLKGENVIKVDSVEMSGKGEFHYVFEKNGGHKGLYRLSFTSSKWVDFVNDGEDVSISTDGNSISDSLRVISSESNKLYYSFIKLNRDYKAKTDILQLVLAKYPKDDDYFTTSIIKLAGVQKEYQTFVNVTSQKNPRSFAARYIKSAQLPVMDMGLPLDKQLAYLKAHTLDRVNFDDDDLIYSDAFTSKSIEYLSLFRNPKLPKEGLEREFMVAVDTILSRAKINQIVYQHVTEYFIDGFKKFGFDEVIDYIVDNYVIKDDICLDEKLKNSIQRRMDQARLFKIGAVVPGIVIPDSTGRDVDVSAIGGEKTLIIFYASWCPHCQEMMPKLNELYTGKGKGGMKVVAVSIDTNRTDWLGFAQKNNTNMINVSDLKGWYGKAAQDFYLYATPTMFLINGRREIIAKPTNVNEVSRWMN